MIFSQIFNTINIGLVILDKDLNVQQWNRWMEVQSGIDADKICGSPLFDFYPDLNNQRFLRNCKSVLKFGNFSFFSQKLHKYLFPFQIKNCFEANFEYMQQSCTMGPIRDEDNEVKFLYIYVQNVTEIASYEKKLVEMNIKDGLTGAYNRRFLDTRMKEEITRCKRYSRALSVIMLDIDHFKKVNDTYGHACGDYIIKAVCDKITSLIRNVDYLIRYGGEEFCCVLPETSIDPAAEVAERFRTGIESMENIFEDQDIKITISLGVANLRVEDTVDGLLKRSDESLYEAKRAGRNRVEVAR